MDKRCESCIYASKPGHDWSCDYYIMTRQRRGCPAGKDCTRYTKRKSPKRVAITIRRQDK